MAVNPPSAVRRGVRILVVEDEPDLRMLLEHLLARDGYDVRIAADGAAATAALERPEFDLVVLDLMLPGFDGLEILKRLRSTEAGRATRVVILTARKDEIDRVLGFELGADDYVTKPFSPRELLLRVRAVLARGATEPPSPPENRHRAGPIEVDADHHEAWVEGTPLRLTFTEFRLLADLVRARGRVCTRETLLSELWGYDSEVVSRTVDTHVRRLRTKLGGASTWLKTVRGVGYRVSEPEEP